MAARGPLDAVTFDLWYTLWFQHPEQRARFHQAKQRAWDRTLEEAGASRTRRREVLAKLVAEKARRIGRGLAWPIPDQVAWLNQTTGLAVDASRLIVRLDRAVSTTPLQLTPGIRSFVARLTRQHVSLGLVSNILTETAEATRARLAAEGLSPWFGAISISSELGRSKPDPLPYTVCLQRLGARAERAVHFGDLPTDVQGAEAAGMRGFLYTGADRWGLAVDRRSRRAARGRYPEVRSWTSAERVLQRGGAPGR